MLLLFLWCQNRHSWTTLVVNWTRWIIEKRVISATGDEFTAMATQVWLGHKIAQ